MKTFYVCSYGGCGSKMLCNALSKYGKVEHIHSRMPPEKLEFVGTKGGGKCYFEWFNGVKTPETEISNYYVIYIYKNPINAILSRFTIPDHLKHIQVKGPINIDNVIQQSNDVYGITNFYDNYTQPNKNRNYKIYCVKYEDIFEKKSELSKTLGIGNLNFTKKETDRTVDFKKYSDKLGKIYENLITTMNNNDFLFIN
jgi:hypothetical protein